MESAEESTRRKKIIERLKEKLFNRDEPYSLVAISRLEDEEIWEIGEAFQQAIQEYETEEARGEDLEEVRREALEEVRRDDRPFYKTMWNCKLE